MAKYSNPGIVDVELATKTIVANGGGVSTRDNKDGSTHYTVYSTDSARHLSYDKYEDGRIENVHSTKDNTPTTDYKGGK